MLYIVTPMSPDRLAQVNTLLRGSVTIPDQLFLKQVCGLSAVMGTTGEPEQWPWIGQFEYSSRPLYLYDLGIFCIPKFQCMKVLKRVS